jgi:hypothetical protein
MGQATSLSGSTGHKRMEQGGAGWQFNMSTPALTHYEEPVHRLKWQPRSFQYAPSGASTELGGNNSCASRFSAAGESSEGCGWRRLLPVLSRSRVADLGAHARFFNPTMGIVEDSSTGTAAGPLACRLVRHGIVKDGATVIIEQGYEMKRPSFLIPTPEHTVLAERIRRWYAKALEGRRRDWPFCSRQERPGCEILSHD